MNYSETVAARRRIPIYLEEADGDPADAVTLLVGEVTVSKGGAAFGAAGGSVGSLGNAAWYYEATQAETESDSFLMIRAANAGALVYFIAVRIDGTGIAVGETTAARRRIPVVLETVDGDPIASIVLTGTEIEVSKNGAAWSTGAGSFVEISDGAYYYEAAEAEVDELGILMIKLVDADGVAKPFVTAIDITSASVATSVAVSGVGYLGAYLGAVVAAATDDSDDTPAPVAAPITVSDITAISSHVQAAIDRLCQYAKVKNDE